MAALAQIANAEAGSTVRAKLNLAVSSYIYGLNGDGVTDDAAAINALLATITPTAAAPLELKLPPGRSYALSAPIVLKSFTTLDISGCELVHAGTGNNVINNAALATVQRQVTDGVLTANVKTFSSLTANFTTADIGRSILCAAGSVGTVPIFTAIITGITSSTAVTLNAAPSASATGVTSKLYDRDSHIHIKGDRSTRIRRNVGSPGDDNRQQSVRLCRVDHLTVEGFKYISTAGNGKYGVLLSDVRDFVVRDLDFDCASDGIHITGPASGGRVTNLSGATQDDMCALGCMDYLSYVDTIGSVSDVIIEGVAANLETTSAGIHLFCGNSDPNHVMRGVTVSNVRGNFFTQCVKVESGAGDTVSTIDDITVRGVNPSSTGSSPAILIEVKVGNVTLEDVTDNGATGAAPFISINADARRITVKKAIRTTASRAPNLASISAGKTVGTLAMYDLDLIFNAAAAADIISVAGQLTTLMFGSGAITGHSTVKAVDMAEQTALAIFATDLFFSGMTGAYVWWCLGAVELSFANVHHGVCYMAVRAASNTSVVTVRGAGVTWSPTIFVDGNGAGGVVRLLSFALQGEIDRPGIQKNNGDMAFNTKAALSCGVGPVVCNGTAWKNLYTGNTY